jgi:hypothetical protein
MVPLNAPPTGDEKRAHRLAQREAAMRRRFQALELRKAGMSFAAIAGALGVSASQASRDVKAALITVKKADKLHTAHLRMLESERLDTATVAIAKQVKQGDPAAIDRWLKLSDARRKLLGLDAPPAADDEPRRVRTPLRGPQHRARSPEAD